MKIDLNKKVLDYNGKEIKLGPQFNDEPLTFLRVISVIMNQQKDEPMTAEVKAKIYNILSRAYESKGETDFSVDEITLMKERIAKIATPIEYGRFCELIGEEVK